MNPSSTQLTEWKKDVGDTKSYPRLGVVAVARREKTPGAKATYAARVTDISPMSLSTEDARVLAGNLTNAAEVAQVLVEEMRVEFGDTEPAVVVAESAS